MYGNDAFFVLKLIKIAILIYYLLLILTGFMQDNKIRFTILKNTQIHFYDIL